MPSRSPNRLVLLVAGSVVFVFSWLLRYNDPGNELGGLIDDHFFYAVPGWQILFGELPDRDFVDPGAPLTFVISAALQVLLGRSIWSEFIFCVTMLSLGAAITCGLAARASRSITVGVLAALFEIALIPRLYNYPKIIIYAVAISLFWMWANRPTRGRTWLVAAFAVVALLLRHDHGVYVGAGFCVLIALRPQPWRDRLRHGATFVVATLLLVSPYFIYLQVNGGVVRHFMTAYRWTVRDYGRAPFVMPVLERHALSEEEDSDAPASEWWNHAPFVALATYYEWWLFWFILCIPPLALLLLAVRPGNGPPAWAFEGSKIGSVIALSLMLNSGFVRGNLAGRFADASVPLSVIMAWSLATALSMVRRGRIRLGPRDVTLPLVGRALLLVVAIALVGATTAVLARPARELLENSRMPEGTESVRSRVVDVTDRLQHTWPLTREFADERHGAVKLALYFQECTAPTDRILVTSMMPQAVGLARRGFAGGHTDLRAGFFGTVEDQTLTIERLRRQSVPIIIGPPSSERRDYEQNLPLIAAYFDREYTNLGDKDLGDGLVVSLLVHNGTRSVRTWEPLSFPCFR